MRISLAIGAARASSQRRSSFPLASALHSPAWAGRQAGRSLAQASPWVIFRILRRAGSRGGLTAGRFAFNRFGPNRFDRFGFNRFNRFGNQFLIGGWGGWSGYSAPAAASEPIVVGGGPPVIINIGVDPAQGDAASAYMGGCVIHKLMYDSNGKYVGERQIPQC